MHDDVADTNARVDAINTDYSKMQSQIDTNTEGIAMAFALSGASLLPSDSNFAMSFDYGHFDGSNALAFGAAGRLDKNIYVSGGLGIGTDTGNVGGRAGVTLAW